MEQSDDEHLPAPAGRPACTQEFSSPGWVPQDVPVVPGPLYAPTLAASFARKTRRLRVVDNRI
eukprot:8025275-Heterocapsa_arctica.AAC.1